jgi:putative oxidoreductase
MKKLLFSGTENSVTTDIMLALFRLFVGLSLALAHGFKKLPPSEGFIEHTGDLGFPLPEFFAYSAGMAEFAGGLLLAIGLFTRPAAFFVAITMFVAGFINHAGDPFGNAEKAYLYFAIAIVYVVLGSGKFSADSWARKRFNI